MMKSFVLVTGAFAATALADACNHDNVLRCLIGSSAVASPYCSSFLSIPVVTTTVSTTTPVVTTTSVLTFVSTSTTLTTTTTTTTAAPAPSLAKRWSPQELDLLAKGQLPVITGRSPAKTSPAPNCITQVSSSSYPASRISSACSCLSVSTSTSTVTATAPTSTKVILTSTSTTTLTTLVTVSTSVAPAIPTAFQLVASNSGTRADGRPVDGELGDYYYLGIDLPYGEYTLTFSFDPTTGYLSTVGGSTTYWVYSSTEDDPAPGQSSYLRTHPETNLASAAILVCSISNSLVLTCNDSFGRSQFTLTTPNQDGQFVLAIAAPGNTLGPYAGPVQLNVVAV